MSNDLNARERIHNEAIKLFKQHGFDNTTVQQICDAANVSRRTFYYHYDSKDRILSDVNDNVGMKAEKLIDSIILKKSNTGMLWEIMYAYVANAVDMGGELTLQVYLSGFKYDKEVGYPQNTSMFKTAAAIIKAAQDAGEISNRAGAEDVAYALYNSLRGVTITWAASRESFNLSDYYLKVFNVILGADYTPEAREHG